MKFPMVFFAALVTVLGFAAHSPASRAQTQSSPTKSTHANVAAARGKDLFQANCAACHFDTSATKKVGPGLKGLTKQKALYDGSKPTTARLHDVILTGGPNMPPFVGKLKEDQISALIAYLKTL